MTVITVLVFIGIVGLMFVIGFALGTNYGQKALLNDIKRMDEAKRKYKIY